MIESFKAQTLKASGLLWYWKLKSSFQDLLVWHFVFELAMNCLKWHRRIHSILSLMVTMVAGSMTWRHWERSRCCFLAVVFEDGSQTDRHRLKEPVGQDEEGKFERTELVHLEVGPVARIFALNFHLWLVDRKYHHCLSKLPSQLVWK